MRQFLKQMLCRHLWSNWGVMSEMRWLRDDSIMYRFEGRQCDKCRKFQWRLGRLR